MPKVFLLPHYHYENLLSKAITKANSCQSDFKFYLLPPDENSGSPLKKVTSDFLEILEYLDNKKTNMGLASDDLLLSFFDGKLQALNYGLNNLFMAGSRYDEPYPCTGVISLKFISWGILEEKYSYELQQHALLHLTICGLLGSYTRTEAHYETFGCLFDFNNNLFDFNAKLQKGYYLCSQNENDCYNNVRKERYGNAIIQLCSVFREAWETQEMQHIIIKELIMGDKIEGDFIAGDQKMEVLLGDNATIYGDFVVANSIKNSFNKAHSSDMSNELLKDLLKELSIAVGKMSEKLPQEGAVDVAEDLETLVEQATRDKPKQKWWSVSIEGLTKAAENIGKVGEPVLNIISQIVPLLEKISV
jgi:hypothetical protein